MATKRWNMASYPDMHALMDKIKADSTDAVTNLIVQQMQYIGEKCVTIARDKAKANTWRDITGNLRSSIGYIVQVNGKPIITSDIPTFEGSNGKKGGQGPSEAKALLKSLQGIHQSGVVLIVVAGMQYASLVENLHSRDVLASSWLEGEKLAHKLLDQLFSKTKS